VLDSLGLYEQGLRLFDQAGQVMTRRGGQDAIPAEFVVQYFNATLNHADQALAKKAIEQFSPAIRRLSGNVDLQFLLIEAHQLAGDEDKAADQITKLEQTLKELDRPIARRSLARELALFFTYTVDRPFVAMAYARKALDNDASDPVARRLLGCAQVISLQPNQVQEGLKSLEELYEKDAYAAACLGEYYFKSRQDDLGVKVLLAGANVSRSGPAFRRLAVVAKKYDVALPRMAAATAALEAFNNFDQRYFQLVDSPEKFVEVTVKPLRGAVRPCDPVEVEVTLTNRGPIDLPIGPEGLFNPSVAFQVQASGAAASFTNLPMALLPAPRYLSPGRSVSRTVRLDAGQLELFLMKRAVNAVALQIDAVVDPVQRGKLVQSTLGTLKIAPAAVRRIDAIGQYGIKTDDLAKAYQEAISHVVREIKQGSVEDRMRAARQVGSLLAALDERDRGTGLVPKAIGAVMSRPVLLSMANALLQDAQGGVRAEMVAALNFTVVDETVVQIVAPLAADRDAAVRLRLAELLGGMRGKQREGVVQALAADENDLVRAMAAAFKPGQR